MDYYPHTLSLFDRLTWRFEHIMDSRAYVILPSEPTNMSPTSYFEALSSEETESYYIGGEKLNQRQYYHYLLNIYMYQSVATARYAANLELSDEERLEAQKPILAHGLASNAALLGMVEVARRRYLEMIEDADAAYARSSRALMAQILPPQEMAQSSGDHSAGWREDHEQAGGVARHVEIVEEEVVVQEVEEESAGKRKRRWTLGGRLVAWTKSNQLSCKIIQWASSSPPAEPLPEPLFERLSESESESESEPPQIPSDWDGDEFNLLTRGQLERVIQAILQPWFARGGQAEFETRFSENYEVRDAYFNEWYHGRRSPSGAESPSEEGTQSEEETLTEDETPSGEETPSEVGSLLQED